MGSVGVLPRIARIAAPGEPLRLRRAWPHSPGRLTLEYTCGDTVVAGHRCSERGATREVAATGRMALVEVQGELVALPATATDARLPGLAAGARLAPHRAVRPSPCRARS